MQQVFKRSLFHSAPIVLKRQLHPLSCGHAYILMAAESPFFIGGEINLSALSVAVGVCSRDFASASEWINSDLSAEDARKWGKECRDLDFAEEAKKFREYLSSYAVMPERFVKKDSKPCRHPWPLITAVRLMLLGIPEERAWNMHISMALSLASAHAETQGDDSLESEEERQMIESAKAAEALRAKEQNEKNN